MKFGHAFKDALERERYPPHWVDKAIPYRRLKKLLAKVREELIKNGYDPDTLHKLLAAHEAEYRLRTGDSQLLRPKLVVRPAPNAPAPSSNSSLKLSTSPEPHLEVNGHAEHPPSSPPAQHLENEWVKIPLDSDSKFFGILQADVVRLDSLQSQERKSMNDDIVLLGTEIAQVAKPQKGLIRLSKSDLYRWREIFELYLAAQVFFSTTEATGGDRSSTKAHKQLVWFQDEVAKRQLPHKFKLESSGAAYSRFLALNVTLLQNLQFQELNQTAITKIIKKFDKQTSLGVKAEFPKVMNSATFIAENIAKNICAQLSSEVVGRVPQIVDYTCTICTRLAICWLPIRLDCNHIFCIRCMIKMQNRNKELCPLCRASTVQLATEGMRHPPPPPFWFFNATHIDIKLMHFLEQWFPKETKEKQKYNEIERRKEMLGDAYAETNTPCSVM
ncbi:SPX domain-containing protein [Apodospora peruviana]|uniref:SPX domain-containing protein n=1 Tax=Apodospora peruviana TaxID=516989 RepID=A0AAE0M855_9PEZI|nr:SPX domain-containing protein [Apodospora peruviana]